MKKLISLHLNGEAQPQLLMTVIRFAMPERNHTLKKLCLLYLEVVDKTGADGKLLPEMILVCNFLRNDLQHPNEYVRGVTLRFLCRLREPELLEPLVPAVRQNLEHRHAYVRRHAVLALHQIYRHFEHLCPDAPELLATVLEADADASCKRNALLMLSECAPERAQAYLDGVLEQVPAFEERLQLLVVGLVRQLARVQPTQRGRYARCVFALLSSSSPAVQFEAAGTLLALSAAPAAVRQAVAAYVSLLCTQPDPAVKLVVLERLERLRETQPRALGELLMDLLRALAAPSLEIRRRTLAIAMDLVTQRNVDEVLAFLRKEIQKTQAREFEHGAEYRQLLVHAIRQCALRFPETAAQVVLLLVDFVGDQATQTALDVVQFAREVLQAYPAARPELLRRLSQALSLVQHSKVHRALLWLLAEHAHEPADLDLCLTAIHEHLGEPPYLPATSPAAATGSASSSTAASTSTSAPAAPPVPSGTGGGRLVLPDGTYATQSAFTEAASAGAGAGSGEGAGGAGGRSIRALICSGDALLAVVVAQSLTKLALKARQAAGLSATLRNTLAVEAQKAVLGLLRLGQSLDPPFEADAQERLATALRALGLPPTSPQARRLESIYVRECLQAFARLAEERRRDAAQRNEAQARRKKAEGVQADDLIRLRQLRPGAMAAAGSPAVLLSAVRGLVDAADESEEDPLVVELRRAAGLDDKSSRSGPAAAAATTTTASIAASSSASGAGASGAFAGSSLGRVQQLSGFSDPLYAEAVITAHQYDILLEVRVVNQTSDTLQNVALELATLGDLRLVERPAPLTMGPFDRRTIRASIKVSSTETGVIFGQLVYDVAGQHGAHGDRNCVVLQDIHLDVIDYIAPQDCGEAEFRRMWAEFEWENKVPVVTQISDPAQYLQHILRHTNMRCLNPQALIEPCDFLSANLYARSIFGEDALANVSIERSPDGRLQGFIRIRCKTQGIALSLGDKIAQRQKVAA